MSTTGSGKASAFDATVVAVEDSDLEKNVKDKESEDGKRRN